MGHAHDTTGRPAGAGGSLIARGQRARGAGDKTGEVMRQCEGVVAVAVPDGLSLDAWRRGLLAFARAARDRQARAAKQA